MKRLPSLCLLLAAVPVLAQPSQPPTTKPNIVQAIAQAAGLQARIMWMDATGNLDNLDTREKVADVMEKCRRANINTVVVDVKPLVGEVMYPSRHAARLTTWRNKTYDAGYDLLRVALDEGHSRGLKVYAAINVFSEGHKYVSRGPAYTKPDWQSITYVPDRYIVTVEGSFPVSPLVNDAPPANGMAVYTPGAGASRAVKAGETYTVVDNGVVQVTAAAEALVDGVAPIPARGFLLVGSGSAADWMADRLRAGVAVRWETRDRLVPISQAVTERISVFANPIHPEVRQHELDIIRELATNYDLDGIVFDRMRYANINNDFSQASRRSFEQWAGVKTRNWPADVMQIQANPSLPDIRGPYFERWLEWRARNIRAFAREASDLLRSIRPTAHPAAYVGSWYPVYYSVGVNWASDEYAAEYDWMTSTYHQTGYAPLLDWICTGTYYPEPTRASARANGRAPNATVEAAAELSNEVVNDAAFVYASLNVPDYQGKPAQFLSAINAALSKTQGVMVFDLVYIIQYSLWGTLAQAFPTPATAPHDIPELLKRIQDVRAVLPPVPAPPPETEDWRLIINE
jgi:uncharacterized lipoprotein YddW (UPF0748 family)